MKESEKDLEIEALKAALKREQKKKALPIFGVIDCR